MNYQAGEQDLRYNNELSQWFPEAYNVALWKAEEMVQIQTSGKKKKKKKLKGQMGFEKLKHP